MNTPFFLAVALLCTSVIAGRITSTDIRNIGGKFYDFTNVIDACLAKEEILSEYCIRGSVTAKDQNFTYIAAFAGYGINRPLADAVTVRGSDIEQIHLAVAETLIETGGSTNASVFAKFDRDVTRFITPKIKITTIENCPPLDLGTKTTIFALPTGQDRYDYGQPLTNIPPETTIIKLGINSTQIVITPAKEPTKDTTTDLKTLEWQIERAQAGSSTAQFDLAMRYLTGQGVTTDTNKAVQLLTKAAAQNHTPAKLKLADLKLSPPPQPHAQDASVNSAK